MIETGLMKSERLAAERGAEARERALAAATRLDPPFPYAKLSFPEGYGAMDDNEGEQQ